MKQRLRRFSFLKTGRLILSPKQGLRARAVRLAANQSMGWHSTHHREELLLVIQGKVVVEAMRGARRKRSIGLKNGEGLFIPKMTKHSVSNASGSAALYVYVTGQS